MKMTFDERDDAAAVLLSRIVYAREAEDPELHLKLVAEFLDTVNSKPMAMTYAWLRFWLAYLKDAFDPEHPAIGSRWYLATIAVAQADKLEELAEQRIADLIKHYFNGSGELKERVKRHYVQHIIDTEGMDAAVMWKLANA